jgi:hypothetical protein
VREILSRHCRLAPVDQLPNLGDVPVATALNTLQIERLP